VLGGKGGDGKKSDVKKEGREKKKWGELGSRMRVEERVGSGTGGGWTRVGRVKGDGLGGRE